MSTTTPDYDRAADIIRFTSCAYCGMTIPQSLSFVVKRSTEEHFCGESCANEYYLERLRESGL